MRRPARWIAVALALPSAAAAERESFELVVPLAPAPVVVDGRPRLGYELHLTNFSGVPLRPTSVEVVDRDGGRVVERLRGATLDARIAPAVAGSAAIDADGAVAPGARAVVYLDPRFDDGDVPASLSHRVAYETAGAAPVAAVVAGAAIAPPREPAVLGPPLRGGPWVAVHDPAWARGHRRVFYAVEGRATLPGRFAIDFVKVDADGRLADGDGDLVRAAYAYGAPVLAVADGTVAAVRDDYPEAARISANGRHPLSDGSGNFVVLDIGGGRNAVYEHLKPGSARVRVGERVRRGAVLAAVGFSGSGNWPHLHFHLADAPSLLGAEGLPFVFDGFREIGRYGAFEALGERPWTAARGGGAARRGERPGSLAVLEFE